MGAKAAALSNCELGPEISIVVFGSWARDELTEGSDDDWAVVVAREFADYDADVVRAMALAQEHLGGDERKPGSQAVFGVPFDVNGLVNHIGLDADSNRNLTRRMLLLLESRELAGTVHAECWSTVLERYLRFGIKNNRPPRFLLNDLVRYWRTICVAREELKAFRAATRDGAELWQDIRTIGEELQRGLNVLLFDTPLRHLAPQYAIF